jgi:D-beta-D-heptose 7-phosphate kinase/D-beta-D-heptose 1-phosphate adenosyltransferase
MPASPLAARIIPQKNAPALAKRLRRRRKKIVFTNGVFDILHRGHVEYLAAARALGDILIVGLNTDASVRRLKGPKRPLQPLRDRAIVLLALASVDYVVPFGAETPKRLIESITPDILVKGADYKLDEIVGADHVLTHGGKVHRIRLTSGRSSSKIITRLK